MRARFLSTLLGLTLTGLLGRPVQAQQSAAVPVTDAVPRPCGTDQAMREALGAGYESWWQNYRAQLQQISARRLPPGSPPVGPRLIVPVVVHIIHTNGSDNIGDDQVYDAIRILNEVFNETDPDTAQVIPYFKPRIGNTNIEFRMARLDPNGNCTTGITRHFSNLTNSAGENVKNLPDARWVPQRYMNIWVVENIASGAAGYSYLPCGVGPNMEGIVILNDYFGSIGRAPNSQYNRKSFPHEVGHYLGLPHTWGRTNTPGTAANCQDDDGISDTPNTVGYSFNCDLNAPSCPGDPDPLSNVQNIMDYAGCPAMFTQGQAAVMNGGIVSAFACRTSLGLQQNLTLAGVADGQNVGPCAPIAFLTAVGGSSGETVQRLCAGDSARFRAEAYNVIPGSPVQFRWRFPGGVPATSTLQEPTVTYPTPGLYNVVLYASNTIGTDSVVQTGYVKVQNTAAGLTTPIVETFDDPTFPLNASDPLKNWEVTRPSGNTTWEYTNVAAAQGTGSVRLRLRNTAADTDYDLISPNIVITNTLQRPYLYFKRAYSQRTTTNADRLTISYSLNCGVTWITRGASSIRSAAQLSTANPSGSVYVPTPAQWRQDSIILSTGIVPAGTHVMVRFRMSSDLGNVIYLDDIRIGSRITGLGDDALVQASALTIYPNPSDGEALVRLSTGRVAGTATVRIYDAAGRLLGQPWRVSGTPTDGGHEVSLRAVAGRTLAAGVYVVELTTADGARQTQRALVY